MSSDNKEPYQSWLKWLCQMLPGISQAILILKNESSTDGLTMQWPQSVDIRDDMISAASLSAAQQQNVTTTLSSQSGSEQINETVIALPITVGKPFSATLAVCVRIKPSQQPVVLQLIKWAESSLTLLLKQYEKTGLSAAPGSEVKQPGLKTTAIFFSRAQWILLVVFIALMLLAFIPGNYRITAPASLEGKIQRAIVAPFDGYISTAYARAGETVKAGDKMAELDNHELLLQKQQVEAEKNEYTRQYRQALAQRDKANAHIFKSQVSQADSQINLLKKKIERSSLLSPLDGVIISGDLSRSLGTTVETGDVLFEVAPLNEYRLIILVDEQEVVNIKPGLTGILNLKALNNTGLKFSIHKVSPVFEENANGIAYRVEAKLEKQLPSLRPGMQGIAKIEIAQRKLGWIYLHKLYYAIRIWVWSWLP